MNRIIVIMLLVIGLVSLAAPASATPEPGPGEPTSHNQQPPPETETPDLKRLPSDWSQLATDYNCWVTAYGLLGSSLSLFITGTNPAGFTMVVIKTIIYTGRLVTFVTFVNSCLDIDKVEEQLSNGVKFRCVAGGWIWVPGSRTWQC